MSAAERDMVARHAEPADALIIKVSNVSKNFGATKALIDISMEVRRGEARALIGRNGAGKSTLVSMLTGLLTPSAGEIRIYGESAKSSQAVSCVYQHSRLVPSLTVAENIVMGRYPSRGGGAINWREIDRLARDILGPWELEHLARRLVEDIAPVQKKVVEVCRALSHNSPVLMLDEPTAGLDREDAEQLFHYIDRLKRENVTLIYVSHHFDEIYRFCDSATILRDSRVVMTAPLSALPKEQMIAAMMGETAAAVSTKRLMVDAQQAKATPIGLSLRDLHVGQIAKGVDLEVRRGECIGIAGLDGSGKIEIGAAIAGLIAPTSGTIRVGRTAHKLGDVGAAIAAGIGYVPENRHLQGMVLSMSVAENSTLTALGRLSRRIFPGLPRHLSPARLHDEYTRLAQQWAIRASGPNQLISELSGGNQQKCVLARALASRPAVLVLQHPTAGVDVAAKASIMQSLQDILQAGASIIVISEDADDFALATRILVVNHGRIGSELGRDWTDSSLLAAMQGPSPVQTTEHIRPEIAERALA